MFSLAAGALLTLLCALFGQKHFFPALTVVTALLCLNYIVQNVYFSIFTVFLSPGSVGEAGGVMADFRAQALVGVFRAWPRILLLLLPLAARAPRREWAVTVAVVSAGFVAANLAYWLFGLGGAFKIPKAWGG